MNSPALPQPATVSAAGLVRQTLFNVRDYNATGGGVTDDTAAIHAARDAAGPNGVVYFPAGTYRASLLSASVSGKTWRLENGATIQSNDNLAVGNGFINVIASGVTIEGGTIDGRRGSYVGANQPSGGIFVTADGFRLRKTTLLNILLDGVYLSRVNDVAISDVTVLNSGSTGIYGLFDTANKADIRINRVLIDRTGLSVPYTAGGLQLQGNGFYIDRVQIDEVVVKLPVTTDSTNVCYENWSSRNGTIGSVLCSGGGMGAAFDNNCEDSTIASLTILNSMVRGLEISGGTGQCKRLVFGSVSIDGKSVMRRGVEITIATAITIGQLSINNCGVDNGGNAGNLLTFTGSSGLQIGTFRAYGLNTNTGHLCLISASSDVNLGVIEFDGAGTATGLRFFQSTKGTVSGGHIRNCTNYLFIDSSVNAQTLDDISVSNVEMPSVGLSITGGAVLGPNARIVNCPTFQINGANADVISLSASGTHLVRAWGTGTPASVVTAAVGSTFLRTDGGTSTTFYVKESGTGNTGWVAK